VQGWCGDDDKCRWGWGLDVIFVGNDGDGDRCLFPRISLPQMEHCTMFRV